MPNAPMQPFIPVFPSLGWIGLGPLMEPAPAPSPGPGPAQSCGISCAHTAIIPKNSVIDASAAASSTNIFNIPRLLLLEHRGNIVLFLFFRQGALPNIRLLPSIAWLTGRPAPVIRPHCESNQSAKDRPIPPICITGRRAMLGSDAARTLEPSIDARQNIR